MSADNVPPRDADPKGHPATPIQKAIARQTCRTRAHREQLFAFMEHPEGTEPGDTIAHFLERDLRAAGYVVRSPRGLIYSTPKGEGALRDGLLR